MKHVCCQTLSKTIYPLLNPSYPVLPCLEVALGAQDREKGLDGGWGGSYPGLTEAPSL